MKIGPNRKKTFQIKDHKNARDIALFVLLEITENHRKSHTILKETFAKELEEGNHLSGTDRAFIERIAIGSLDRMITLDTVLERFLSKPLRACRPLVRAVLRLSVYQLMYMDRVPASAVCNEGVELVRLHGMEGMSGFVNGVLRSVARDLEEKGDKTGKFTGFSQLYSMPEWICRLIEADYGKEKTEEILGALLEERNETVRLNLSHPGLAGKSASEAESFVISGLAGEGFELSRVDMEALLKRSGQPQPEGTLPVVYRVSKGRDITRSGAFQKGYLTVQDPASALVASFAAPSENAYVIDVCAAPGGKTLAAADLMHDHGSIDARDVSEQKTALITENVSRCGFKSIRVQILDALKEDEDSFYRADVLLADLPCSGIGVIGKKPDIKYNLQPYTVEELQELQRDILTNVSRFVKPKGRLVYSTCTITKAENEENVEWMESFLGLRTESVCKLLPTGEHDGFFIAVMKKRY